MPSERIISIYGPGLLGGSLALAIQKLFPESTVRLWARRASAEMEIRARGIDAEFFTDGTAAAAGASLIILATPVETMKAQAADILKADLAPDCLVTDVGSVKGTIVRDLEPILGRRFIGSHPMAGSEKAGIEVARADLFQSAACLLTPTAQSDPARLARLHAFWSALGCRMVELTPEDHDEKVARISHLPRMMASVLTLAALKDDLGAIACVANGFRDSTRVAAGDAGLWTGIAMENRTALLGCLRTASATLTELLEILEKPDEEALRRFLAEAKTLRDQVPAAAP